jgi:hypothetical protein
MKRLLVSILLFAAVQFAFPMQVRKSAAPANQQAEAPGKQAIVVEVKAPPKSRTEIEEETKRTRDQERTNHWNIGLTAVIALASLLQFSGLLGQILIYGKQAKIMSDALDVAGEQARTAETAAVASQKNTEALMNAERAWIAVVPANASPELHPLWEPGDPEPKDPYFKDPFSHAFPVIIKNVGRTPARVKSVLIQYVLIQHKPDLLPAHPAYIDALKEPSFLLVQSEETPVLTYLSRNGGLLTKEEVWAIQRQQLFLYGYGIVEYKDVYERPHETRFGYVYHFPQSGMVNFEKTAFRRRGPESYNRQT